MSSTKHIQVELYVFLINMCKNFHSKIPSYEKMKMIKK
jgi:hypothetical protein